MNELLFLYELLRDRIGLMVDWRDRITGDQNTGKIYSVDLVADGQEILMVLSGVRTRRVVGAHSITLERAEPWGFNIIRGFNATDLQRDGTIMIVVGNQYFYLKPSG